MTNTAIGIILVIGSGFFAYMTSHIIAERKANRTIPLPWERGNNPDLGKGKGDNT